MKSQQLIALPHLDDRFVQAGAQKSAVGQAGQTILSGEDRQILPREKLLEGRAVNMAHCLCAGCRKDNEKQRLSNVNGRDVIVIERLRHGPDNRSRSAQRLAQD